MTIPSRENSPSRRDQWERDRLSFPSSVANRFWARLKGLRAPFRFVDRIGEKREHRRLYRPGEDPARRLPAGRARAVAIQCRITDRRLVAEVSANLWPEGVHRPVSRLEQSS